MRCGGFPVVVRRGLSTGYEGDPTVSTTYAILGFECLYLRDYDISRWLLSLTGNGGGRFNLLNRSFGCSVTSKIGNNAFYRCW